TAHGVGTVQSGSRATDDLDTLNGFERRQEVDRSAGLTTVQTEGVVTLQGTAVDQEQGVVGSHAANADRLFDTTTGNLYARHMLQGVGEVGVGFLLQLVGGDDGNRSRC